MSEIYVIISILVAGLLGVALLQGFVSLFKTKKVVSAPKKKAVEEPKKEPLLPQSKTKVIDARIDPTLVAFTESERLYEALLFENEGEDIDIGNLWLHCTLGEYHGNSLRIPEEGILVGRDPARANLVLNDLSISGVHLKIGIQKEPTEEVVIEDMDSTNGTAMRNVQIGNLAWLELKHKQTFDPEKAIGLQLRLSGGIAEFTILDQS